MILDEQQSPRKLYDCRGKQGQEARIQKSEVERSRRRLAEAVLVEMQKQLSEKHAFNLYTVGAQLPTRPEVGMAASLLEADKALLLKKRDLQRLVQAIEQRP